MIYINVPTTDGDRREKVYSIADFPYNKFAYVKTSVKHGKHPVIYLELSAAFDIETTNITDAERPWAFMYQWQFCAGEDVCFGRRWEDFREFLERLRSACWLAENRRIVIWVHNLPFEFQFFRRFLRLRAVFIRMTGSLSNA